MSTKRFTHRTVLLVVGLMIAALIVVACATPPTVAPTAAPQIVRETVVVAGTPQVVEKVVTATPPPPTATVPPTQKVVYISGTQSLTGAYAEDSAAILAAFEDYAKYVNETKLMAPWRTEKFPADVKVEVLWRDDELKPEKALSIYDELKAKNMLVYRISGSPIALALMDKLNEDRVGATSMATGPVLLSPPKTIFTYYPIYTDDLAAIADWFKENWKESRKPRVAYLTADNAMGHSIEIPELRAYLEKIGYEYVGAQYVPLVPTAPPTTQLLWLKENKVDLALGVMINPGSQPTYKEMVRLDMGPNRGYKITLGTGTPSHLQVFLPAMGADLSEGFVVGGGFLSFDDPAPGMKFLNELQTKYRPSKKVGHVMYVGGLLEAMIQTEALRLAMQTTPVDKLKPVDVLENGFYKIKNLDTGGLSATPITYAPGKIEGVNKVRVDQIQKGKIVNVGLYPARGLYKHE
ncbi:MAG: ABC transporter substrate-binding protein [Chloroflexi bacterium]|nr:ABC transporter substrate-binding protein [Chloroflexota bacterium]